MHCCVSSIYTQHAVTTDTQYVNIAHLCSSYTACGHDMEDHWLILAVR